jgi:hypothetical protein
MTYVAPERARWWEEGATPEERRADVERVMEWFRTYAEQDWIAGGAELGRPQAGKTVRKRGVNDRLRSLRRRNCWAASSSWTCRRRPMALDVAPTWPGRVYDDDAVEVRPEGTTGSEV